MSWLVHAVTQPIRASFSAAFTRLKKEIFWKTLRNVVVNGDEEKVVSLLSSCNREAIREALRTEKSDETLLAIAVRFGQTHIARILVVIMQTIDPHRCTKWVLDSLRNTDEKGYPNLRQVSPLLNLCFTDGGNLRIPPLLRWWVIQDASLVRLLIRLGADVNYQDEMGITPLMLAAASQNQETLSLLLNQGAQVDTQTWHGETALLQAVLIRDPHAVNLLLEHGAKIVVDDEGCTPLLFAAASDQLEVMIAIGQSRAVSKEDFVNALELYAAFLAPDDLAGAYRFLQTAMKLRHSSSCNVLWKPASDPHPAFGGVCESQTLEDLQKRQHDSRALLTECLLIRERVFGRRMFYKRLLFSDIFDHLLEAGHHKMLSHFINAEILSLSPDNALMYLRKLMKEQYQVLSSNTLAYLEAEPNLDSCIQLFRRGHEVHHLEETIIASLHFLDLCLRTRPAPSELGRLQRLTTLFIQGFQTLYRWPTPFHLLGTWLGRSLTGTLPELASLLAFLADCGADVNARDEEGMTPLHLIAMCPRTDLDFGAAVRALLAAGADPGLRISRGRTPLKCAVTDEVKLALKSHLPPLVSIATSAVVEEKVPTKDLIPKIVEEYVNDHR